MTMKKTTDSQNISDAKPEGKRWRQVHYRTHINVHWIIERLGKSVPLQARGAQRVPGS